MKTYLKIFSDRRAMISDFDSKIKHIIDPWEVRMSTHRFVNHEKNRVIMYFLYEGPRSVELLYGFVIEGYSFDNTMTTVDVGFVNFLNSRVRPQKGIG